MQDGPLLNNVRTFGYLGLILSQRVELGAEMAKGNQTGWRKGSKLTGNGKGNLGFTAPPIRSKIETVVVADKVGSPLTTVFP